MAQKDELKGLSSYSIGEAQNIALGQSGSIFVNGTTNAVTPPAGSVFVAIQIVGEAVFDSGTDGLIGENDEAFPSTVGTSQDIDSDGGAVVDSITFPAGLTIYGRWVSFKLDSGSVIAYID
jgi:hypothetical protein